MNRTLRRKAKAMNRKAIRQAQRSNQKFTTIPKGELKHD